MRFTDEELKHQELFRRVERMIGADMPAGYRFTAEPNAVAAAVLQASTWAVLGLTCDIEIFTQVHYRASIQPREHDISEVFKDVFLHHWQEESQHAILDELEWRRENARLAPAERDKAVDDLIGLVGAVDGILQLQARADADYFLAVVGREFDATRRAAVHATMLAAYRWQYIASGVQDARFLEVLGRMINADHGARINAALAPIVGAVH